MTRREDRTGPRRGCETARRRPARRLAILAALTLLMGACERDPLRIELPEGEVLIHAILRAGTDSVFLSMSRMTLRTDPVDTYVLEPVRDARAELREAGGAVTPFHHIPFRDARCVRLQAHRSPDSQVACYLAVLPEPVRSGGEYQLHATLPDGAVVQGSARVPEPPQIVEPGPGARLPAGWTPFSGTGFFFMTRDPVRIQWRPHGQAAAIGLAARVTTRYMDGRAAPPDDCRIAGSGSALLEPASPAVSWQLHAMDCGPALRPDGSIAPDSLRIELMVTAHDSAYARYFDAWDRSSAPRGDLTVGLAGAIGLFSATAATVQPLVMYAAEDEAARVH